MNVCEYAHDDPELLDRYVLNRYDHLTIGTSHQAIDKIVLALGFKYCLNRGRYRYYDYYITR